MDRPFTLQFPVEDFAADWQAAESCIRPAPGVVYVEMAHYAESIRSVLLPDFVKQKLRADAGIVIASGKARSKTDHPKDSCLEPPRAGTRVLVLPYKGDGYIGFHIGETYRAQGVVRVYGIASTEKTLELTDWTDSIVAELESEHRARPVGKWVLLRRDPRIKTEMGLELPESQWYRTGKATVVDAGLKAQTDAGLKAGQKVHYKQDAITIDTEFSQDWLVGDPSDYCFIKYMDIFSIILEH